MKTVVLKPRSELLHIEAPGCIINIRVQLADVDGREVTAIEVLPDSTAWIFADAPKARAMNIRVRKENPSHGRSPTAPKTARTRKRQV